MAYDTARGLIWQVNVGGDNGLYGIDPSDGSVVQVDHRRAVEQHQPARPRLRRRADVFYVGGWNEGIVYRVAGPS